MVTPNTYKRIEELLPKTKNSIIECLDIGCNEYYFTMPNYHVHRCDVRLPANIECRYNFKLMDLNQKWEYPNNSFHVIRACEIIEH